MFFFILYFCVWVSIEKIKMKDSCNRRYTYNATLSNKQNNFTLYVNSAVNDKHLNEVDKCCLSLYFMFSKCIYHTKRLFGCLPSLFSYIQYTVIVPYSRFCDLQFHHSQKKNFITVKGKPGKIK